MIGKNNGSGDGFDGDGGRGGSAITITNDGQKRLVFFVAVVSKEKCSKMIIV